MIENYSYAATIGFFDGVHRGHQYVIEQLKDLAKSRGLKTLVVTFDRHPREVVQKGWSAQLLTTLEEKRGLLTETGIDRLVVLPFDEKMAGMWAEEFMEKVLWGDLGVRLLLTGYDNRFGHDRTEGFEDYCRYGKRMGMEVVCGKELSEEQSEGVGSYRASSSCIRGLLTEGMVEEAAKLLGRYYSLGGLVVHGEQRGRLMGFPTANLQPDSVQKMVPKPGVYAVKVKTEDGEMVDGMTNIGTRPTFNGVEQTIETHLLSTGWHRTNETDLHSANGTGWHGACPYRGDLYGKRLELHFVARLRDERTFDSPEALARQLEEDKRNAEEKLIIEN